MKKYLWLLLMFISACQPKIVSYINSKAAYDRYETYRMVSPKLDNNQVSTDSDQVYDLIKENIAREMDRRSYQLSSVSPDLTLRFEFSSSTRVETNAIQDPFYPVYRINSRTIHEAILLLELYTQDDKLVWQGSYDLDQERREKKVKKVIENAVSRIFTSFPYKALNKLPDPALTKYEKKK